jgi:hypothetical protein
MERSEITPTILSDPAHFGDSAGISLREAQIPFAERDEHYRVRYFASDFRFSAISFKSAFCGSANFSSPSRIS